MLEHTIAFVQLQNKTQGKLHNFLFLLFFKLSRNEKKIERDLSSFFSFLLPYFVFLIILCARISRIYIFLCTRQYHIPQYPPFNETALTNKLQPEPSVSTWSLHVQGRPLHTYSASKLLQQRKILSTHAHRYQRIDHYDAHRQHIQDMVYARYISKYV